ncbi:MAG TPA: FMN-binding negative transcriptional regulator [Steroidobacteraceae bacterium]|nr:FMN-binding negative transcriptional regulator [Steroidobacteraceae bacterium]
MDRFAPPSAAAVLKLIEEHPLAWVVSMSGHDSAATLLPLRPRATGDGRIEGFVGHFARSNAHVEVLRKNPGALLLFLGPHGYISPSWLSDRTQAPTWNYAAAQFLVDIEFFEDPPALRAAVDDLVGAMERDRPGAWSAEDMAARYERLAAHIIGFRATVRGQRVKFKLGQDERDDVFHEIRAALRAAGSTDLAGWMEDSNAARGR